MPCLRQALPFLCTAALFAPAACGGKEIDDPPVTTAGGTQPSENLQAVLQYVKGQMSSCTIPGGAIAVVENGKRVDAAGVGVKGAGMSQPVTPSTLFLFGGSSEPVVGLTALALAEEGKLDLSHPVTDYVPLKLGRGFDPKAISVDQVLLGTAGLPEFHSSTYSCGPGDAGSWFSANTSLPLWSPPGVVCNFSHLGDGLVGWVIESVTSQSFADAAAARVFAPAGMKTATYDPTVAAATDHALGQNVDANSGQVTPQSSDYSQCSVMLPADGLYASVLDYASLAETLLAGGGTTLDPASVSKFETGQVADYLAPQGSYAYGLYQTEEFLGIDILHVGGSAGGFHTEFWLVPSKSFAVVVVFNAYNTGTGCGPYDTAKFAMETYLGLGQSDLVDWTTPMSAWAPFLGTYFDPYTLGKVTITLEGDQLLATTPAFGSIALTQSYATAFNATIATNPVTVTFQPDDRGPAGWFVTPYGVARRQ
jgi:CubicO group peptidase (beta-lactamase class C family)